MSEAFETLLLERTDDGIAVCTFNRPEVRNALNLAMVQDLRRALEQLAAHEGLRALIFTGAGDKAFLSGADIAELRDRRRGDALAKINNRLFRELEQFPTPTIAAIRGWALGGGCEIAMACDLRIAGEGARLGQPEVALGIIPGAGACYRLPRLVGVGVAKELIYTGRIVKAAEALRIGLVNRVVPDDQLLDAAHGLAAEIAANSAVAVRLAKVTIDAVTASQIDSGMALESTAQAVLFEDPEKVERMTAFLERKAGRKKS